MDPLGIVVVVVTVAWLVYLCVAAARYWVDKKNLSPWRATWRVVLISAIPVLAVGIVYLTKTATHRNRPEHGIPPELGIPSEGPHASVASPGDGSADQLQRVVDNLPLNSEM